MLSDKNPSIQKFGRNEKIILTDEEKLSRKIKFSEDASKRMKENNPMFREDVRKKVSETARNKRQNLTKFRKSNKRNQTIYGYIRMGLGG